MTPSIEPSKLIPAWKKETAAFRALGCVTFLGVHGLLSDAEANVANKRIMKWCQAAARLAAPAPEKGTTDAEL